MGTLENTFTWSNSRSGTFRRCARAYWWQYYGAWGGWEHNAPAEAREAYALKNLDSRWAWAGSAVHEWIEHLLKRMQEEKAHGTLRFVGDPIDVEAEVEALTNRMRQQYVESLSGSFRDSPKRNFRLMEHEYGDPVSKEEWKATSERAREALRGFLHCEIFQRIRQSDPKNWFPIESLVQFDLEGVGVWAVPDFAMRTSYGGVEIFDWKTGAVNPDGNRLQMACYTLYTQAAHEVDPTTVRNHLVYLGPRVQVWDFVFTPEELAASRAEIVQSMDEMRSRLADVETNRAEREDFPLTDDRGRCAVCPFRRLCRR